MNATVMVLTRELLHVAYSIPVMHSHASLVLLGLVHTDRYVSYDRVVHVAAAVVRMMVWMVLMQREVVVMIVVVRVVDAVVVAACYLSVSMQVMSVVM